jgi:Flp pilus assembly protein TadD
VIGIGIALVRGGEMGILSRPVMIPGLVLLLVSHGLGPDLLSQAREAFTRGDYVEAEQLGLAAAAAPPHQGAALYEVGLARFRAGRPAQALEALDAAGRAEDAPDRPMWQFNRAACLYQLGRFLEAEGAYLEAARGDIALAPLAFTDAGFAALDRGDLARARTLAAHARRMATGRTQELVDDLEASVTAALFGVRTTSDMGPAKAEELSREGMTAFTEGDYAQARREFRSALQFAPLDGRMLIMAGVSALALGKMAEARAHLDRALSVPLEPDEARLARDYLDRASYGIAGRGLGWALSARLGGGYDSNALQAGLADAQEYLPPGEVPGEVQLGGAAVTAGLGLAHRRRLSPSLVMEVAAGLDELAYPSPSAEDYSLQQDSLRAALEYAIDPVRLGLAASGQLAFTGLERFRGLQATLGGSGWIAIDWNDLATTRLDAELDHKQALRSEFDQLTGERLDLGVAQQLRLRSLVVELAYHYVADRIGTLTQPLTGFGPCDTVMSCTETVPFAFTSNALTLAVRLSLSRQLQLGVAGGCEWRSYTRQNVSSFGPSGSMSSLPFDIPPVPVVDGATDLDRRFRNDVRAFGNATASLLLGPVLSVALRYDVIVNNSNIDLQYDNRNYVRNVLMLETTATW